MPMISLQKADAIAVLQADILRLEGFKPSQNHALDAGLGPLKHAFPNASFPLGAMHEFHVPQPEDAAATAGFLSGLISTLMRNNGATLWISAARTLFPPALKNFGLEPDRFIFIDLKKEKDTLWAMDEALKCSALTAVIGEVSDISFTASRRLQLAVEQSQVTGFILRHSLHHTTTACVSRWKITSLPGEPVDNLPGIGFPNWHVELLKIRNGKPGVWDIHWRHGQFKVAAKLPFIRHEQQQKTG
jgi:protein ImuA